jgi:dTDP-6-deoxy-L-talose 4-dehydrogenase (NAD+)
VAVTGGRGFIGRALLRALAAAGHETLSLERPASSPPAADERVARVDLSDAASVRSALADFAADVVVHLAWYAHSSDYLTSRRNLESLSTTLTFAAAAFDAGVSRLVGAGSCVEYAATGELRREDGPLAPTTLYAATKLGAYFGCTALGRAAGAEVMWARIFHIHGPGEHAGRLIPRVRSALRERKPFALSPGEQVRDQLHVDDVAAALVTLATSGTTGAYNVCSGTPVTLRALLTTLASLHGDAATLRFGERAYAPDEVMFLAGDSSKLRRLGWAPKYQTLAESLTHAEAR